MNKIPTLYSDYKECILDLDIYGKIVATPQQSIEELTNTLFEEFKRRKPLPTLEYKRYELSRLVNPEFRIAYNKELELQDNESLIELANSISSFEAINFEDLTPLISEVQEEFSYEKGIKDSDRQAIIDKYNLETGEVFKPGILETENIVGSVIEDENSRLTDEQIDDLGSEEEFEVLDINEQLEPDTYEDDSEEIEIEEDYIDYEVEDESDGVDATSDYNDDSGGNSIELDSEDELSDEDDADFSDYDYSDSEDESDEDDEYSEEEFTEEYDIDEEDDSYDDYGSEDSYGDSEASDENSDVDLDESSSDDYSDYDYSVSDDDSLDEYEDNEGFDDSDIDFDDYDIDFEDTEEKNLESGNYVNLSKDDGVNSSFVDSVLDEPRFEQHVTEPVVQRTVQTPVTPAQVYNNIQQPVPVDRSAEPTDIRAFLRKHPRCEYSFALQYFTKKQINDAIKIGKIVKKGNILKI